MTEQEFLRSKNNMLALLKQKIEWNQSKVNVLKSYQIQVENVASEEELRQLHKEIYTIISE